MDIKVPAAELAALQPVLPERRLDTPPAAANLHLPASAPSPTLADLLDIHPLDVPSALRIVVTEVRAAFAASLEFPAAATVPRAALQILNFFLQVVADDDGAAPTATPHTPAAAQRGAHLEQAEATLQLALERAQETISAWRDVSTPVADAAQELHTLVNVLLHDDPVSPLWLQIEWLALAPKMQGFWRKRRRARRRLADPDARPSPGRYDEPHA